ncbi:MAG: DUF2064 domain-containing protein [Deltaproteobacteria bacterium]|nr:DUF2064 domain-containing protein [Deltaproteobacteria bacterium]
MKQKIQQPTLLVFTLGAAVESRRRRLLPGSLGRAERRLHQKCLDDVLEAGRSEGFRLEVSCPRPLTLPSDAQRVSQLGSSFGERLVGALEDGFRRNGSPLFLVGSDIPDLQSAHLRQAAEHLKKTPRGVVIGPSPDGGIYLLASNLPLGELLLRVRWCRSDCRQSLLDELRRAGLTPFLLEPLSDLDQPSDLEQLLAVSGRALHRWQLWLAPLRSLLASLRRPLPSLFSRPPKPVPVPVRSGRAPPYGCEPSSWR